jgi:beta-glucosidase
MQNSQYFPENFLWGVSTSAYQIEGYPLADGAGQNIWHRFSHTPGMIANGDTGDIACDHYHRYNDDVKCMQALGLQAYRFSVSWSRVLPEGRGGRVNTKGLDFYERLVDALLEHNIQPMTTLYHWDLPVVLEDNGGWLNRDSADWFAEYAQVLFNALDDRVRLWNTLNEPWVVVHEGYLQGHHAPGHRNVLEGPLVVHNLLRAHAMAVQAYRAQGRGKIGIAINLEPKYSSEQSQQHLAATVRAHSYTNKMFLDPLYLGVYPEELQEIFGSAWLTWPDEDMQLIQQPIDFIGINYYTRGLVRDDPSEPILRAKNLSLDSNFTTEMGWEIYPQGLVDILEWVNTRYGRRPIYITENGAAFSDSLGGDGAVNDQLRSSYLRRHLRALHEAIQKHIDLRGYFVWSFLDNFEWSYGYSKRFGIVHVDYESLIRTPKASAYFYSEAIRTNGANIFESAEEL